MRRSWYRAGLLVFCMVGTAVLAWEHPERGSALRADLMDAARPLAEYAFGASVVFVVDDLRVHGGAAFGNLRPVRPSGAEIGARDLTPAARRRIDPAFWDGPQMQVLFSRGAGGWFAAQYAIGATDVWWADPAFCPEWGAVIPEFC
ncbi:hypothetical protein [Cognatishimia sp. F0-27]|uniref:hypothetical protein n=1 Tax=Cognatishimia sp. F0-27 TaxID=2816855 RepID=UPI001D0C1837|nr:hypothetical protein [Cognatishimia sp. F0-27]MCC1492155.1 hypothetical protein [Cognatishimia sp. F0-27]